VFQASQRHVSVDEHRVQLMYIVLRTHTRITIVRRDVKHVVWCSG
jgi:hypothetical protein